MQSRFRTNPFGLAVFLGISCLLTGCAVGPDYRKPELSTPANWHAPLPHRGDTQILSDWWSQFDDPLLAELIAKAEQDSPSLAQAVARIAQSRAQSAAARSALWPNLNAKASHQRSGGKEGFADSKTIDSGSLDAGWEFDIFGANRRGREAAEARYAGAQAYWHDARVSLAAEVAQTYVGLRTCEALLADAQDDLDSRRATEEMSTRKTEAGFGTPADTALAEASAADAANQLIARQAECDIGVKTLVALTGIEEPALRDRLASGKARLPMPASLTVDLLPAQVLRQRPDLIAAERELAAASADIGSAQAARYPSLTLSGSIGVQHIKVNGFGQQGKVWGFGPSLDLPIFDAGRRAANVDLAQARYDEAFAAYRARARQAVREVEQALVTLDSISRREAEVRRAASGYEQAFQAAEERWQAGLASQLELEEIRRLAVGARSQHLSVRREAVSAWISLYRAVGGSWTNNEIAKN